VTAGGLRAGVDQLGTTAYSTTTLGSAFGPDRYDGAAAGRDVAYGDRCSCFAYVGGTYAIP
jgi:hypothetical protein